MTATTDTPSQHINKFSDATLRELYTLQDERKTAELLNFLNDKGKMVVSVDGYPVA